MAVSSAGAVAGDDRASAVSTERTPLLHDEERGENQWQSQSETGEAVLDGQRVPRDGEPPATKEYTTAEVLLIMSSVWVGVFFAALDMTVVSTLSAPISSYFNSLPLLSWVASSYLVSTSACQPLSGKLTDIFSRKSGLILSNILFGFGNLISGLATEQWMIILGRVIAGMGGGGLNSISTFLTSDLVPLRRRGVWQGVGNICFGVGSAAGGLFGGWVNDKWGWRWAFLIQVPFMVLSTVLVAWKVNVPAKESDRSRLKRIDFLGAFTLTVSLVLLLVGLNTGGNQVPWTHPLILTSLPLSAVFLGVFVYVEEYKATEPIIPVRLLVHRTVLSACLTNWFCTMNVLAILTYAPIYFQIQGNTATQAGARLAPYASV
ncbi:hypothetical protein KEM55_004119 [Ascosphaera atra]|nr:hypothetical protein KEM55_004119 [Ascosphaera atra]